jgi:hypothetical protein
MCSPRTVGLPIGPPSSARSPDAGSGGYRYSVVSEQMSDEALELFVDRQMAELMVENWNRDEPDRAGELYVEPVELETSVN